MSDVGGGALGVADGVGGWQDSGINPAEYSAMFMDLAKRYLEGEDFPIETSTTTSSPDFSSTAATGSGEWMNAAPQEDPASVLTTSTSTSSIDIFTEERTAIGALDLAHQLTRKPGSATACVLRMVPSTGELEAANLGDSGFLIIRDGQVYFQSPPLQHFFDCPYQFGAAPEFTPATDTIDDAEVYRIPVRQDDVIILATDGVLDNVWTKDIVSLAPRSAEEVDGAADALASLAAVHGLDETYESPYCVEASLEGLDIPIWEKLARVSFNRGRVQLGKLLGGKLDDVTVVIGYVEETEGAQQAGSEGTSASLSGQDY